MNEVALSPERTSFLNHSISHIMLELSQGKCRWPISNPGAEDFCFCGNEPVKGLPYCLGHARIAYRSVGRQRSSRRETR